MPGSTVTTFPAARTCLPTPVASPAPRGLAARRRGRARGRSCSPKPAASITSPREPRRRPRPRTPGPDALERRQLRREADLVGSRELVGERARSRTSACSPSSSRRPRSPRRRRQSAPARSARRRARRAAARRSRRRRRSSRTRGPSAPCSWKSSLDPPRELALGPADERSSASRSNTRSVIAAARADRLELRLVLDGAQPLDEPARRHELEPAAGQRLPGRVRSDVRSPRSRSGPSSSSARSPMQRRASSRSTSTPSTPARRSA